MSENINQTSTTSYINANITASIPSRIPNDVANHMESTANPHNVSCEQIGAMPYNLDIVIDPNYIHTDNNFTNDDKLAIETLNDNFVNKESMNEIENKLNKLDQIDEEITNISNLIPSIESGLDKISTMEQEVSRIDEIDSRTASLESNIANIDNNIDNLSSSVATNSTNIDNLTSSVENLTTDITLANNSIASNSETIQEAQNDIDLLQLSISNKVDKVSGKGLSTEDFTTELKDKLISLSSEDPGNNVNSGNYSINRNYLINPDFALNTRGATSYASTLGKCYTVDRWIKEENVAVSFSSDKHLVINNSSSTDYFGIGQYIVNTKSLLGNTVTITLSCESDIHTFTINNLPTSPTANSVIHSYDAAFGKINFEYHTNHFILKILPAPTTSVTLNFAKVEIGSSYSGFEYPDTITEKLLCYSFYQPIETNNMYNEGTVLRTSSLTTYLSHVDFLVPMRSTPTFINNNTNGKIQVCENNSSPKSLTYKSITTTYKSKDLSRFHLGFTFQEDNSTILEESTSKLFWCALKYANFAYEAEIFD